MIHFLRTKENKTIIECEVYSNDLSSAIDIYEYSMFLLNLEADLNEMFVDDINNLNEIRGLWWEKEKDFGNWKSIDEYVASQYKKIGKEWGLKYVTD